MSKDMDEHFKLVHTVVDAVERANRETCMTLLRYSVGKPESFSAHIQIFARKKEDEKFQQFFFVNYKLGEIIYLLDVMNSVFDKVITNQPICIVLLKPISSVHSLSFFFYSSQDDLELGENRNLFLKLKSKLGLYPIVLTTPKTSPEIPTLTVDEMQQLSDIEKTDSKEEKSRRNWTIYNGRRKVCVNFHTNTDKLKIVVYRYRNILYLKHNEVDLKLTEYQSLLAKRIYLLSYIDFCWASRLSLR